MKDRARARELARNSHRKGDPTGGIRPLYQERGRRARFLGANLRPNPLLLVSLERTSAANYRKAARHHWQVAWATMPSTRHLGLPYHRLRHFGTAIRRFSQTFLPIPQ